MVTRIPASIAFALICAVAASGALEATSRPALLPSAQRVSAVIVRPASAVAVRTERGVTRGLFSTSTSVRSLTVLRPAQAVVISPRESASKGGRQ